LLYQLKNEKSQNDCAAKINILATNFFLSTKIINLQNITSNESATHFLNIEETVITN